MKGSRIRVAAVWSLVVFVASLSLTAPASTVLALEDEEMTEESLEGLKGISVMVPPITPDPEPDGLKREQILTSAELRIRKAGIKLLTDRELTEMRNFPYLSLTVNAVKNKRTEQYSFDIKAELYKQEILNPDDVEETQFMGFALLVPVKTWSSELTGSAPGKDLRDNVQKHVDDLVDKFINAYLTANPKKK